MTGIQHDAQQHACREALGRSRETRFNVRTPGKEMFPGAHPLVEVLAGYSKQAHRKINRLSTAVRALQRLKSGETRSRASQGERHSQRYRIADRFSSEDLAVIAQRYEAGEQSTELAKERNIAKSTLLRLLTEQGVLARQRGLTPEKECEIIRLRKQGLIIRDLAKRVGCSYDTARKFLLATSMS